MIIVVIWLVCELAVAALLLIIISVVDNKKSVIRLFEYVVNGYDAIVIVIAFIVIDLVCVGMYNQGHFHSCDVKWRKVGI